MHVAARCGRLAVLHVLLASGQAVDSLSLPAETTPLHLAAGFSRLGCVQELLRRGADPSRENKRGATPLDMVGTLVAPPAGGANGGGDGKASVARQAYEKKLAQGQLVKVALRRAQRWQRRRGIVLVWETLRNRAAAAAAGTGGGDPRRRRVGAGEEDEGERAQPGCGDNRKRRCRRGGGNYGEGAPAGGQGWLVVQLCAHPDQALMRSVIKFL